MFNIKSSLEVSGSIPLEGGFLFAVTSVVLNQHKVEEAFWPSIDELWPLTQAYFAYLSFRGHVLYPFQASLK